MSSTNNKFIIQNLFNVQDWVCVVTGGGTGIGLMIAQAFANNGARVYITSRRLDVLEQTAQTWGSELAHPNGKLVPLQCDVTDKKSIQELVKQVSQREKAVDVLVNNAGIAKGQSEVEKADESAEALSGALFGEDMTAWEDVYRTNVISYFYTTAAFIPLLNAARREDHTGTVINISSISGITHVSQNQFKYNVSKAATIQLNTLLAQDLTRSKIKIRVNSIAPGLFPSEMTTKESDERNKSSIPVDSDFAEKMGTPAGRPGRDEDLAQAVLMLACNEYAYGQTISIDGGTLLKH